MARTMNTDTYEALQATGLSDAQAKLIATAIPDLEPLRVELRGELRDLRSEMDHRFAQVDAESARLRGEMQQGFTEMDAKFAALWADLDHRGCPGGHRWLADGHQPAGLKVPHSLPGPIGSSGSPENTGKRPIYKEFRENRYPPHNRSPSLMPIRPTYCTRWIRLSGTVGCGRRPWSITIGWV